MSCALAASTTRCACGAPLANQDDGRVTVTSCTRSGKTVREALTGRDTRTKPVHGETQYKHSDDLGSY